MSLHTKIVFSMNLILLWIILFIVRPEIPPAQWIGAVVLLGIMTLVGISTEVCLFLCRKSNKHDRQVEEWAGRNEEQAEAHGRDATILWNRATILAVFTIFLLVALIIGYNLVF